MQTPSTGLLNQPINNGGPENDPGATGRRLPAGSIGDALLLAMLAVQWTTSDQVISATLATVWLLWCLAAKARQDGRQGLAAAGPLILILLLNLRGLVFQEGTQPVAHMDYIIIIAAFVAGLGRSPVRWLQTLAAILTAGVIGIVLNLNTLLESITAIVNGTADLPGWRGQEWAGQYFRAGEMSVNQTAFLTGITLTLALATALHGRGRLRRLSLAAALPLIATALATGSRLALLLSPLAALASLLDPALLKGTARAGRRARRLALAALVAGVTALALSRFTGGTAWLIRSYVTRKLGGDQDRLEVLACYTTLPFSDQSRWALGVGYGEAWKRFCDEDVGIHVTHAHNLIAQLMAETGLLATLAVILVLGLLWLPLTRRGRMAAAPGAIMAASDPSMAIVQRLFIAAFLYIVAFAMFELAFLKVTVLECLIGYLLSMSFCRPGDGGSASPLPRI